MTVKRSLGKDPGAAVEGLPLQLIIMVAVAAIVLVVILGWLAPWQDKVDLDQLTVAPMTVESGNQTTIVVTAWDTKNNHLEGVVIEISGANVGTLVQTTGSDGTATFTVTPSVPAGITGNINIVGKFTGTVYTERTAFVVVS